MQLTLLTAATLATTAVMASPFSFPKETFTISEPYFTGTFTIPLSFPTSKSSSSLKASSPTVKPSQPTVKPSQPISSKSSSAKASSPSAKPSFPPVPSAPPKFSGTTFTVKEPDYGYYTGV